MKRLLKLGVAAFTALSMVGTPMSTFAESNDPEKEELTEHYWYDNENQKVYTFSEDGQWQAIGISAFRGDAESHQQSLHQDGGSENGKV